MRVLLVSHGYPPTAVAGVERLSAQAAEELVARGHEVTVLTHQLDETQPALALRRDVRANVPVISIVGPSGAGERFPARERTLEGVFERTLVEVAPDVVLITHLLYHSPGYVAVAQRWRIPVVLELHDFFAMCPRAHLQRRSGELCGGPEGGRACAAHCFPGQPDAELRWSLRARSFGEAVRCADEVLAPSRFVADTFAPLRDAPPPIRVVGNSVAALGPVLRSSSETGAPLHLASIGFTAQHKGFHVVVEALRRSGLPSSRYTIIGGALQPQVGELREAADEVPGLELRIFGGFEPAQLPVLLADVHAVVVPSLVPETYSIVVREAFACGVPVIASRIGAIPDAIRSGDNGWLFAPGDASELAALLARLGNERILLRRAAAGIRPDDVISVPARVDRVEEMLRTAVERCDGDKREYSGELLLMRDTLTAHERAGV